MFMNTFHDASLTAIKLVDDGFFMTLSSNNSEASIVVAGLKKLRIDKFMEGNIVNTVKTLSGADCLELTDSIRAQLVYLYDLDTRSVEENASLVPFIDSSIDKIVKGELILLEVEPSYGSYILALCETIKTSGSVDQ